MMTRRDALTALGALPFLSWLAGCATSPCDSEQADGNAYPGCETCPSDSQRLDCLSTALILDTLRSDDVGKTADEVLRRAVGEQRLVLPVDGIFQAEFVYTDPDTGDEIAFDPSSRAQTANYRIREDDVGLGIQFSQAAFGKWGIAAHEGDTPQSLYPYDTAVDRSRIYFLVSTLNGNTFRSEDGTLNWSSPLHDGELIVYYPAPGYNMPVQPT